MEVTLLLEASLSFVTQELQFLRGPSVIKGGPLLQDAVDKDSHRGPSVIKGGGPDLQEMLSLKMLIRGPSAIKGARSCRTQSTRTLIGGPLSSREEGRTYRRCCR